MKPAELPAELVRHVLGLLGVAESLVATAVARARRECGDAMLLVSLEEIIAHLVDGHDSGHLIDLFQTARRDLDAALASAANSTPDLR